ncbi:MAG: M20/M25/M40 family metallo-hydrolase [Gemmatimonadetes bacterium]|nr:M20/M25/M40 family metallo-hydrolase [Gemmatimonadota bacterium]
MSIAPLLAALAAPALVLTQAGQPDPLVIKHRPTTERLIAAALADSAGWDRIAELTDRFGHRLSGSAALEHAIDWVIDRMKADGLEQVRGEPVMVPRWVRGRESAEMVQPRYGKLPMLGLGGSIGTPPGGITAEVLVVSSFADLEANAAKARGRIVLSDVPFTTYGATVQYRGRGAIAAAKVGAVASMIRSVGPFGMRTPHTGGMGYDSATAKIPGLAITAEDAAMMHRMQRRGERIVVHLEMGAHTLPDAPSRNVVGEIVGREYPDQIVVMGGHIDSWDVGTGAMDDAGGVVIAWEAVRLMHRLGIRPRRTIRVVGWTNEENGLRGGTGYRDTHRDELAKHVLAIESDGGVFRPTGFGFTGSDAARALLRRIAPLLAPVGADSIGPQGGGADIGPIMQLGVPGMSHNVDGTRYFWYHHSEADNVDKLDPREVAMNVAAMAVMGYLVAEEGLPR